MREELDIGGFLPDGGAAWSLITEAERQFRFQDAGWNPQFQTWSDFNQQVTARFKQKLREYEQQIRKVIEGRGGKRVQTRYSTDNFKYYALDRFARMSAAKIFKYLKLHGDYSTVTKGKKAAAKILTKEGSTETK
jgi:hypothetical protein